MPIPGAFLVLTVCLKLHPGVCRHVVEPYRHADGQPTTYMECLGAGGQQQAQRWLEEHPDYVMGRVGCAFANDGAKLREQLGDDGA